MIFWALGLIFAFALLQFGLGEHVRLGNEPITFGILVYHSGETFFTLGYGDITPVTALARTLAVMEGGMGFAFLGVVVGYLPVIYSSFSTRELEISLLDSRAGSPPSAGELLSRLGCCPDPIVLDNIFRDWERWSADLLASHISYPVLCFFRSQHSNQSWLGALTTMLDVTSVVLAGVDGIQKEQAKLTFAMARHAAVDLAQVVNAVYDPHAPDRLPPEQLDKLRQTLIGAGLRPKQDDEADKKLLKMRSLYEPYCEGLAAGCCSPCLRGCMTKRGKTTGKAGPGIAPSWPRAWVKACMSSTITSRLVMSDAKDSFTLAALQTHLSRAVRQSRKALITSSCS